MARITVEDCLDNIGNIFEMVLVAAKRARRVAHGAEPMVELENDKPTVVALREIAAGHVTPAILEEIDTPPVDDLLQAEVAEELLPARGLSTRLSTSLKKEFSAGLSTGLSKGISIGD